MMDSIIDIVWIFVECLTAYTAIIGLGFILPSKKVPEVSPKTRFAILIPARNEESVIGSLIESLLSQNYPKELFDIIVIPNNCTDKTEETAIRAGAKILNCNMPVQTKGEVLHHVFETLMGSYDAYCVFDADNLVHVDFLSKMNDAVVYGALVAKSRQCALNPYDNWISGGYDLYFQNIHLFHSRARMPFPLSAKLIGTGFMVTDKLLQTMGGWNTVTLTEDIEFAVQCAQHGVRVQYIPEALTYDEQPTLFRVSMCQRRRWSSGVQCVALRYVPKLLIMRPKWLRWDLAAHVSMIHVQMLALIPSSYGLLALPLDEAATTLLVSVLSFWCGTTVMALFLALSAGRSIKKQWKGIALYPLFIASWYPLHIAGVFLKTKKWKPITHGVCRKNKHKTHV